MNITWSIRRRYNRFWLSISIFAAKRASFKTGVLSIDMACAIEGVEDMKDFCK